MLIYTITAEDYFYPRSPCGERQSIFKNSILSSLFLSTLSLRRATPLQRFGWALNHNFYPRSPCGERLFDLSYEKATKNFYPRSPCGERPGKGQSSGARIVISIHALLAESDNQHPPGTTRTTYFYPRSPCGERRKKP